MGLYGYYHTWNKLVLDFKFQITSGIKSMVLKNHKEHNLLSPYWLKIRIVSIGIHF